MNRVGDTSIAVDMLKEIDIPPDLIDTEATNIVLVYNESNRHYHRFSHIKSMYHTFHEIINYMMLTTGYKPEKERIRCCVAAILYHDFVYDTQQISNHTLEELSAEQFLQFSIRTGSFDVDSTAYIVDLIASTGNHVPINDFPETLAFLDADMEVLSANRETYIHQYAAEIRKEWSHVSDSAFTAGRMKFLRSTLEKTKLFYTDFMIQKEEKARENLRYELKLIDPRN